MTLPGFSLFPHPRDIPLFWFSMCQIFLCSFTMTVNLPFFFTVHHRPYIVYDPKLPSVCEFCIVDTIYIKPLTHGSSPFSLSRLCHKNSQEHFFFFCFTHPTTRERKKNPPLSTNICKLKLFTQIGLGDSKQLWATGSVTLFQIPPTTCRTMHANQGSGLAVARRFFLLDVLISLNRIQATFPQ